MKRLFYCCLALALALAACGGAASAPAGGAQLTRRPEATAPPAVSGSAVPTAFPATAAPSPVPAIAEPRAIELEWPASVRMGNSDLIRLALVYRADGYLTPTAEVGGHTTSGTPIEIPNLYDTHTVLAVARLASVGFEIDRPDDWEQTLQPGESLRWQWTIAPKQSGAQVATLVLRLRFVPKDGGEPLEREILNRALSIHAVTVLGFSAPAAQWFGGVGAFVGAVMGFPFLDKVLAWSWARVGPRLRKKKPSA